MWGAPLHVSEWRRTPFIMAKDPAFLFYPGDWLGGTLTFSRHHKGAYMDLLMCQFNNGHMSLEDVKTVLGQDFEPMWESKLKKKFTQDLDGLFYNTKMEEETSKRRRFTEGRRLNLSHKGQHLMSHMDAHVENENEDGNDNKKKRFQKPTRDELIVYMAELCEKVGFREAGKPALEADKFLDHHDSKGWIIGRVLMQDWKAAARTWIRNAKEWAKPEIKKALKEMPTRERSNWSNPNPRYRHAAPPPKEFTDMINALSKKKEPTT